MSRAKFLLALAVFGVLTFTFTLRVAAIPSGSVCESSGGCSSPCANSGSGSSIVMSASGSSQCSPASGSSCTGGGSGVCGVYYHYTGANCDSGMIDNSYPVYSGNCN
jgi:hypothetical protein